MPLAYGFVDLEHLFARRVNEVGVETITRAIDLTLQEHNRTVNALLSELVSRTTEVKERVRVPGQTELQPLDEWGIPRATQEYLYIEAGYPLFHAGDAIGRNRVARALMTVQELNDEIVRIQAEDGRWIKRHLLAALLDNQAYTFTDPRHGSVTVHPLANGDAQLYPFVGGTVGPDDHYRAVTTISDSSNPFRTIYQELAEHPGNRLPYVALIANNLRDSVESLASFVPVDDPDIQRAATQAEVSAQFPTSLVDEPLGKVGGVWVGVLRSLPDNYIVAFARGESIVRMRELPAPELQGLVRDEIREGNIEQIRFYRSAGFGVWNRTGAVAVYVGGTTYQVPSGYDAPLG
jgi:hypothetical protein